MVPIWLTEDFRCRSTSLIESQSQYHKELRLLLFRAYNGRNNYCLETNTNELRLDHNISGMFLFPSWRIREKPLSLRNDKSNNLPVVPTWSVSSRCIIKSTPHIVGRGHKIAQITFLCMHKHTQRDCTANIWAVCFILFMTSFVMGCLLVTVKNAFSLCLVCRMIYRKRF